MNRYNSGRMTNFRDLTATRRYFAAIRQFLMACNGDAVSTTEIVATLGGSSNQARTVLDRLLKRGEVVLTGQARATRYYWRENAPREVIKEYKRIVRRLKTRRRRR